VKAEELQQDKIYRMKAGDFAQFSRIGGTGLAVCHPYGEPDMQSCFAIDPEKIDREATLEEARAYKKQCCAYDPDDE
jgi:hypothetical protein